MSRQLHRLFLATIGTVVLVVAGATSALAGMMPDPADPGVPRHPLPGSHYQFPGPAAPTSLPDEPVLGLPWQYVGSAVALTAAFLLLVLWMHHAHGLHHVHHFRGA